MSWSEIHEFPEGIHTSVRTCNNHVDRVTSYTKIIAFKYGVRGILLLYYLSAVV